MKRKAGAKDFMSLTNEECELASEVLLKNAERKYLDAITLANEKSFGSATSYLILSTEETMKAFILIMDSNGFQFRRKVDGVKSLFTNHSIRYGLALILSIMNIFTSDIKQFFLIARNDVSAFLNLYKNKEDLNLFLTTYIKEKVQIISAEINWFSNAEFIRQEGMYVDFSDELKSPFDISEKDFEDVRIRVEAIRNFVDEFKLSFNSNDNDLKQMLEKIQNQFITENWYDKLSKLLDEYKDRKVNPLKVLLNKSQEFYEEIKDKKSLDE